MLDSSFYMYHVRFFTFINFHISPQQIHATIIDVVHNSFLGQFIKISFKHDVCFSHQFSPYLNLEKSILCIHWSLLSSNP